MSDFETVRGQQLESLLILREMGKLRKKAWEEERNWCEQVPVYCVQKQEWVECHEDSCGSKERWYDSDEGLLLNEDDVRLDEQNLFCGDWVWREDEEDEWQEARLFHEKQVWTVHKRFVTLESAQEFMKDYEDVNLRLFVDRASPEFALLFQALENL